MSATTLYRPLPNNLTIKDSDIYGKGLFTTEEIGPSINLGMTHVIHDNELIRTPLGGFINHSNEPNCVIISLADKRFLYTIKPIKKNEEIKIYYTLYQV